MLPAQETERAWAGLLHRLQAPSYDARQEPTAVSFVKRLQGCSLDDCTMQGSACTAKGVHRGILKLPSKGFCLRVLLRGRCLGLRGSYTMDSTLAP